MAASHAVAFLEAHGYALLFLWLLVEQSAIPLPSVPLLLAAGALIRAGRLDLLAAAASSLVAVLIADTVWFELGKRRGGRLLRLLCRISLEPDSCVRRTENAFLKYGMKSLLISKFVPGLNAVAAPLAGGSKSSYWGFLLFDSAGTVIWIGAYLGLGYAFSGQLEAIVASASGMGTGFLLLVLALFGLWIGRKYLQRRRFLRQLDVARITPEELRDRLEAGEDLYIVDLRGGQTESPGPIPGAVRIALEEVAARGHEIPRDREIILFCP